MGMTMTEKILARGAGRESVRPGDLVLAKVDFAMGHDLTIPPAGKIMREQMGAEKIWDPDRVAVTQDHFQPAKDAASATLGRLTREFSHQMGIKWYFEVGQGGICHTVLPENGLVLRYRTEETDDGLPGREGTFLICSFWLVSAFAEIGEVKRARDLCERLLGYASPLGLYAEEIDPLNGRHLGNFPQAFTHLALINAVMHVIRADEGVAVDRSPWSDWH